MWRITCGAFSFDDIGERVVESAFGLPGRTDVARFTRLQSIAAPRTAVLIQWTIAKHNP